MDSNCTEQVDYLGCLCAESQNSPLILLVVQDNDENSKDFGRTSVIVVPEETLNTIVPEDLKNIIVKKKVSIKKFFVLRKNLHYYLTESEEIYTIKFNQIAFEI